MEQTTGSANGGEGRPLVSIITPFLNTEKFLEEAIESVLAQSYNHWELLLVNDGSSDNGPAIAHRYAAQYPAQIQVLEHADQAHRGLAASLNLGVRRAGGRYLTFLDADDVYLPDTLERQVAALEAQPEAGAVYGPFEVWWSWSSDPQDARRDSIRRPGVRPDTLYHPPALFLHSFRGDLLSKPGTSSLMVRRETIAAVGAFEPETFHECGSDLVFWSRISLHVPVFVTDAPLFRYRQHPDSTFTTAVREGRYAAFPPVFLAWLEGYLRSEGIEDPRVWGAVKAWQKSLNREGRFASLRALVRRGLPFSARKWLYLRWIGWRTSRKP